MSTVAKGIIKVKNWECSSACEILGAVRPAVMLSQRKQNQELFHVLEKGLTRKEHEVLRKRLGLKEGS